MVRKIIRSALISAPVELAYKVVADVTKYPEFLPGCDAVTVEHKTDDELDARVTVRASGLVHSFVTTNRCEATTITMALKEGPFKKLMGAWHFSAVGDIGCRVEVEIVYETDVAIAFFVGTVADSVANKVVDAFSARIEKAAAGQVY